MNLTISRRPLSYRNSGTPLLSSSEIEIIEYNAVQCSANYDLYLGKLQEIAHKAEDATFTPVTKASTLYM